MSEDEFWRHIAESGDIGSSTPQEMCDRLSERLSGSSLEQLVGFENVRNQLLVKSYTWPMIKACYVALNYVSDDVFEDFQHWVMLHGRERFYSVLRDPDSLALFASVVDPVEEMIGEPLLFVCQNAWDGDIEELESLVTYSKLPQIGNDWPEEAALRTEFPRLFGCFRDTDA